MCDLHVCVCVSQAHWRAVESLVAMCCALGAGRPAEDMVAPLRDALAWLAGFRSGAAADVAADHGAGCSVGAGSSGSGGDRMEVEQQLRQHLEGRSAKSDGDFGGRRPTVGLAVYLLPHYDSQHVVHCSGGDNGGGGGADPGECSRLLVSQDSVGK